MCCLLTALTVPHSVTFFKMLISSIVNLLLLSMYESASSDSSVNPCVLNTSYNLNPQMSNIIKTHSSEPYSQGKQPMKEYFIHNIFEHT